MAFACNDSKDLWKVSWQRERQPMSQTEVEEEAQFLQRYGSEFSARVCASIGTSATQREPSSAQGARAAVRGLWSHGTSTPNSSDCFMSQSVCTQKHKTLAHAPCVKYTWQTRRSGGIKHIPHSSRSPACPDMSRPLAKRVGQA